VRVIAEFKVTLSITDIQMLFHSYELYNNGLFFYEEMLRDLKKINHNEKRFEYLDAMYKSIADICEIQIRLSDLKELFDAKQRSDVLSNALSEAEAKRECEEMVDSFEFINVCHLNFYRIDFYFRFILFKLSSSFINSKYEKNLDIIKLY